MADNPTSVGRFMRHRQEKTYADSGERQVFFVVVGPAGAVTTSFFELERASTRGHRSLCTGLDWHSPVPRYDGQEGPEPCIWIEADGFCDGTSLAGAPTEEWFDAGDEEMIFTWLEAHYTAQWALPDITERVGDRFGHGTGAE